MARQTVSYYLDEEHIEYIKAQARKNGGATDSAGLRFILEEHRRFVERRAAREARGYRYTIDYHLDAVLDAMRERGGPLYLREIRDRLNERMGGGLPNAAGMQLSESGVSRRLQVMGYEIFRDEEGRFFVEGETW